MAQTLKPKVQRYYQRGSIVPFEEDMFHEFKGHRNICVEELPPWTQESRLEKASRRAVSRNINGFLNTGKGGTIYLGIVDSGKVLGLKLTEYQLDHIVGSIDDLMIRYNPPVKQHRYKIRFVPVVEADATQDEILQQCSNLTSPSGMLDLEYRNKPHKFQTHLRCWCDSDSMAQYNCGLLAGDYVIEVQIKPWDETDPRNAEDVLGTVALLHPYHSDEEGKVYFRRQASLVQYTMTEMASLTRQEVRDSCESKVQSLQEELMMWKTARNKMVIDIPSPS